MGTLFSRLNGLENLHENKILVNKEYFSVLVICLYVEAEIQCCTYPCILAFFFALKGCFITPKFILTCILNNI